MSGDGLRDEIAAALAERELSYAWGDLTGSEREHYRAVADDLLPVVQARIDAAREQVAEQIARTLIDYAAKTASNRIGVDSQTREQFLNGKVTAFQTAADVARQHAKGDGDG